MQKKDIKEIRKNQGKPFTVQQSIPYLDMYKDGICWVEENYYSKTLSFDDINYKLASDMEKESVFKLFSELHNYFGDDVNVQFSYINSVSDLSQEKYSLCLKDKDDNFNDIRHEFSDMLQTQMEKGTNGLKRHKYITLGIEAKSRQNAVVKLTELENQVIRCFKRMGVKCSPIDGKQRLKLLHNVMNPDSTFNFDWKNKLASGHSTKDYIVPPSLNFSSKNKFRMGNLYGSTVAVAIEAQEIEDTMLSEYLKLDENIAVTIHLHAIDQQTAIKFIKRKITCINAMKIDEQKKAVRTGFDMDILPPDITTYSEALDEILKSLGSKNERMFLVTLTITAFAETSKKLDLILENIRSITQKNFCNQIPLDYQQEKGLMNCLPLGKRFIEIADRRLTTSAVAIFIPFTTKEIFQSGDALYYGLNAISNNLIMADRKQLKNPNGLFLGSPGSGKSFTAKREIANVFLTTDDEIFILDPEAEYIPLVNELEGQVIKISPTSKDYINPMDINLNYSDSEEPVSLKSNFIISMCELIIGGKYGLEANERSVIDRCLNKVYEKYMLNPKPENMPILEDLYNVLISSGEVGKGIAEGLEMYVTGSLNLFNHRTNVDIKNRLICFDIRDLGNQLKKLGMLIVQDQIWNRVSENRSKKKYTRYYVDEFHLLLKDEQTAAYSVAIWKRFRKWGGIPTGITQNIKDFLDSNEVQNIFDTTDFVCMLNQAYEDREILGEKLCISDEQKEYVTNSAQGCGLLFFGDTILPFTDSFPTNTKLYKIMTTKPAEQE